MKNLLLAPVVAVAVAVGVTLADTNEVEAGCSNYYQTCTTTYRVTSRSYSSTFYYVQTRTDSGYGYSSTTNSVTVPRYTNFWNMLRF